jgi:predicted secreted Zn-dependent protease
MIFNMGDLVRFIPRDLSGHDKSSAVYDEFRQRGNRIGIIIEVNHPLYDPKVYYTYKVYYQSGCVLWEAEKNLELISTEPQPCKIV